MSKPERYTVAQVAVALTRAKGLRTAAGVILGCSERTVRNYIKRHPELREVLDDSTEEMLDVAEAKLMSKINSGNMTAIIFYLKCKGKARGYIDRQIVEHTGRVEHAPVADLSQLSPAAIDDLVEAALQRTRASVSVSMAQGDQVGVAK